MTLRIVHVMRAPVGGLFRHVVDLAREQVNDGHAVGIIADARTGGERAGNLLADLDDVLALGVLRVPMARQIGLSDFSAHGAIKKRLAALRPDIVHGHGAKGGAFARLAAPAGALRVYTPHGGSLHYAPHSPIGILYLGLERRLMSKTDLLLFESHYGRDRYGAVIGDVSAKARVTHNGVSEAEFAAVPPADTATDLVFVGELRRLKGVDILLEALATLERQGLALSATIVGAGPDEAAFRALAVPFGPRVRFTGALPARTAFAMGRVLVAPSRAESLPYIILEAGAANLPVVATNVGGIREIFGDKAPLLVPPDNAGELAAAIRTALADPQAYRLRAEVERGFSLRAMHEGVMAAYQDARRRA